MGSNNKYAKQNFQRKILKIRISKMSWSISRNHQIVFFFLLQEMREKKTKIFRNILKFFCFIIVSRGLGYFRFRKLDVFAIFNQSDCGLKKNCSDNILSNDMMIIS